MKKREPTPGTVLIVNSIHDPQKRVYTYDTREVSEETANEQLSKAEADRNIYWRGVRYATPEEISEFYGSESDDEPTETTEVKQRRGRKPKEEVVNE